MLPQAPLAAMAVFARHMIASWDIDPVYPVLRQLIADMQLEEPQAEWLVVLYLAYYELTSAATAFDRYPEPTGRIIEDLATLKLPTGIERRGLRDPDLMAEHLIDWLQKYDGRSFLTAAREQFVAPRYEQDVWHNDDVLHAYLMSVRFNGRWASYKAREVLNKVLDYPNAAYDAGHQHSTGPRQGLALFFPRIDGQTNGAIGRLNEQTEVLIHTLRTYDVALTVEEVETLLCDFKSLTRGAYYVGHDTDLMLEGIHRSKADDGVKDLLLTARRALPGEYRGELHGWRARDREAMTAYLDRGAVLYRSDGGRFEEATLAVAA